MTVVKNTPYWNKVLAEIKHLVRIQPLQFPHGLPQDTSDFQHCYINARGELIVKHKLKEYEPDKETDREKEKWKLDKETVGKRLRRTLQMNEVHEEYYDTHYEWKRNEDGKEYRYNFNKDARKYQY